MNNIILGKEGHILLTIPYICHPPVFEIKLMNERKNTTENCLEY